MWLLLGASIADYIPSNSQISCYDSRQIRSSSEDPSHLSEYTFPSPLGDRNPSTPPSVTKSPGRMSIGGSLTRMSRSASGSASRRLTPASSASPSPRHLPISLPPISPRRASFYRRDSVDRPSLTSRPSLTVSLGGSISLSNSASPSDRSTPSLRHVGEGVLDDDSDSSGGEGDGEGEETAGPYSSEDESTSKPHVSPGIGMGQNGFRIPAAPSPLSRTALGKPWMEMGDGSRAGKSDNDDDEDEDLSSPSPRSTSDTETDSQVLTLLRRPSGSHSRSQSRSGKRMRKASDGKIAKSRSRSSTVASLAAPPKSLIHQVSHSSIRTVTAAETSMVDHNTETGRPMQNGSGGQDSRSGHTRQRSVPLSEFMLNLNDHDKGDAETASGSLTTERRIEFIRAGDKKYREITLAALKKMVEEFSEEVFKLFSHWRTMD